MLYLVRARSYPVNELSTTRAEAKGRSRWRRFIDIFNLCFGIFNYAARLRKDDNVKSDFLPAFCHYSLYISRLFLRFLSPAYLVFTVSSSCTVYATRTLLSGVHCAR